MPYFKCVVILLEIYFTQTEASMTLFGFCCFNITTSWKQYVFYLNGYVHGSSKGLEKTLTFKISLKRIFTSSSVIEYL